MENAERSGVFSIILRADLKKKLSVILAQLLKMPIKKSIPPQYFTLKPLFYRAILQPQMHLKTAKRLLLWVLSVLPNSWF